MAYPPCIQSNRLDLLDGVSHGFFGRRGGVSSGVYDSLNVGVGSEDDDAAIAENRTRVAAAIGAPTAENLLSCYQVHGTDVETVTHPWNTRPHADAMVTDKPGLALCILTADCAPILLADQTAGVIGAAHAGWKGATSGVAESVVEGMRALGAKPKRIKAAVGPSIALASYEVGPEFLDAVLEASPWAENLFAPGEGDRFHFNLPVYVKNRLIKAGCGWVDILDHDTCAMDEMYFSNRRRNHRGEPDYGRNASVIMLR